MSRVRETARDLARFVYEALHTKRVARSGWWVAGVDHPESVAEHSFGATLIAWFLAQAEGADVERAVSMALFHDVPEARFNDLHKVAQRYVDADAAQDAVVRDQAASLPPDLGERILSLHVEMAEQKTLEARIAKDADLLECLAQARVYEQRGFPVTEWVVNAARGITTDTGKALAGELAAMPPRQWYEGLKARLPGQS